MKSVDVDTLAQALHEAGREAVEKGLAANKISYPSLGFRGWHEIAEPARDVKRAHARYLLSMFRIAPKMDSKRAHEINGQCCKHVFAAMGLNRGEPLSSLEGISLDDMIEADRVIEEENEAARANSQGSFSIISHCDPRVLAALYTLYNYEPQEPPEVEPAASNEVAAVCVVRLGKGQE